jgi:hypothetical protein
MCSFSGFKTKFFERRYAMIRSLALIFVILALFSFGSAHADLINNGNGFIYDNHSNITWYDYTYNPSMAGGYSWDQARAWVAGLIVGGVSGWQLPSASALKPGNDSAIESQLGNLYYVLSQTSGGLTNTDLFSNLQSVVYWTSTIDPKWGGDPGKAFAFSFITGYQGTAFINLPYSALAVHEGNIGVPSQTPIPGALFLFAPGLAGLALIRKKFIK